MRLNLNGRFLAVRPTGVQRFAWEVGRRVLDAPDVEGVLLLPGGVDAPDGLGPDVEVVRGRASGYLWEQAELPFRARRAGADLVLNLANTVPLSGGPHLVVVHDVLPLTDPRWFGRAFRFLYRRLQAPAIRRARTVLTVSEWSREEIARAVGLARDGIGVVSQGVAPFAWPASAAAVERLRRRLGLPGRYLLTVGGRDPRKNLPFLDTVLRRAREEGLELPTLVVAGDESPPGQGRPVGTAASEAVRFTGRLDDEALAALYTGASLFCFPSLAEGFGRPPLEAMGCGTPVLASDYGPAREVLGDAARLLPLDAEAWMGALVELLGDRAGREELVGRGRARVAAFSWDRGAAAVLEACRAAVAGRPAAPPLPARSGGSP